MRSDDRVPHGTAAIIAARPRLYSRAVRSCDRISALVLAGLLAATPWSGAAGEEAGGDRTPAAAATFHGAAEVVGSRVAPDAASAGRRQVVLTRDEIAALPVTTVHDVLALLPGVGLARRGARGVQGDLNLRGATFEQVLVLVDGVRVNNPQTGHHHLDLFLPASAIERVEVLYGPGSAAYGPDAFGGALNIVTGVPSVDGHVRVGQNSLAGGGLAAPVARGGWLAAEREVHTGFRDNTEHDVNQAAGGWSGALGTMALKVAAAAGSRDFGAHRFYSAAFPDERESTEGELVTARGTLPIGALVLGLSARLSSHRDRFVLDRERPELFENRHRTGGRLLGATLAGEAAGWSWTVGLEGARDDVRSSNLGAHHRVRTAAFAELGRHEGRRRWGVQARVDHQDPWGVFVTAAVGGSWRVGAGAVLRGHVGRAFRAPSFTDLYYVSPATVGDPTLEPEHAWSGEAGLDAGPWSATAFLRRTDDLIDYRLGDDGVWRAANLGRVRTAGVEVSAALPVAGPLRWQRVGVVWLDSELDVDPSRSRYALAHPRLEAAWSGAAALGAAVEAGWAVRFRDPAGGGRWLAVDVRLGRRILEGVTLSVEASNLLDREVEELHGVPLPGRWVSATLAWRPEGR